MDKKMYIVQRAKFDENALNIKDPNLVGPCRILEYDYMGAAEYEWGALPRSIRRISKNFTITKTNIKSLTDVPLWVVSSETTDFETAQNMLNEYLKDRSEINKISKYLLKEPISLEVFTIPFFWEHDRRYAMEHDYSTDKVVGPKFNYWQDLKNDFIFFFGGTDRVELMKKALPNAYDTLKDLDLGIEW